MSFAKGEKSRPGWTNFKGKGRTEGLVGCIAIIGLGRGRTGLEDRFYLVYVYQPDTEVVIEGAKVFPLNALNRTLAREMGQKISHDPGCPVS